MTWSDGELSAQAGPLWRQIADRLRDSIATGEFKPGDALPTEAEIHSAFHVSRATARASLERLRNEGLIRRHSGRGSFVLSARVDQPANALASFGEDMRRRGLRAAYATFTAAPAPVDAEAAEALGLKPGVEAFRIRRLLLADDAPIGMSESWLAPWVVALGRAPTPEELDEGSLYAWLSRICDVAIVGAKEYIEAAVADADMARRLEISAGAPLLVARRRSHAGDGRVVEYAVMHYRADRYRFTVELSRK